MIPESDVEKAVEFLRTSAQDAAVARAQVRYLAEFLETRAAQIARELLAGGESAAAAKLVAKADQSYVDLLDGYKVAVERDAFFTFKREAADAMLRAWQTQCATQRAEQRAYS